MKYANVTAHVVRAPGSMATDSIFEAVSLSALSLTCLGVLINTFHGDGEPVIASIAFSGIAFALTCYLIPRLGPVFVKAGLRGHDMSKLKKPEMYSPCPYLF
jgi:UDP-N-acetylglucosamine--dolichyl-phosphate N-acetylglucosaminephosphotransferase